MNEKDKSVLWRILNLDRRILYLLTVVLMSWVLINPIGLPIQVDEINRNYYEIIESLPPGSIVFASLDIEAGMWGECGYKLENQDKREIDTQPTDPNCIIKGNISEKGYGKIYFIPGCASYDSVKVDTRKGEQYFCTEQEAVDAGFHKADSCP